MQGRDATFTLDLNISETIKDRNLKFCSNNIITVLRFVLKFYANRFTSFGSRVKNVHAIFFKAGSEVLSGYFQDGGAHVV